MRTAAEVEERESARLPALAVATASAAGSAVRYAGREPVAPGTLFQIGSITKVFTALVLARHVVRGELRLEQPVADLLPAVRVWPPGDPITLRELATHSAGLPRIPPSLWRRALSNHPDPYADLDVHALVADLPRIRLRRRGRHRYSNLGFGLLGTALATRTGTTYADLVRREVCEPLGLADTVVDRSPDQVGRSAVGHKRRGRAHEVAWSLDAFAGAGALWSTAEDMQAFVRAQLEPPGDELGEAIRLTQRPHLDGRGGPHGLSWIRVPGRLGATALFHNGGTKGFRSIVVVDPERRRGLVALTNCDRSVDGLGLRLFLDLA